MGSDSDFPALSETIGAINRIASSETEGVNELFNSILRDVALTSKLLRLRQGFDFSLAAQPDVFLVALQNNADILISDIDDPKIATRIPP